MQDILPSDQAQNFSNLALLAMKNDRRAFQSRLLVWTIYEIDPYHVQLFLNHIVSEVAKTFGKSQIPAAWLRIQID